MHALASQTTLAIPKKVAKENAKLTLIVQMISRVKTTAVRIHVLDRNVLIMHFAPQLITTPYALVPTNPLGTLTTNALLSQQVRNKQNLQLNGYSWYYGGQVDLLEAGTQSKWISGFCSFCPSSLALLPALRPARISESGAFTS